MLDIQEQLIRLDKVMQAEIKRLEPDKASLTRDKLEMLAAITLISAKHLLEEVADYTNIKLDKIRDDQ
ncbi:MAG: hypothetical protein H6743_03880 [Rickettsiaceae bacterium]|nr:hypothetical protein [Rickettsiaceae bacterium]